MNQPLAHARTLPGLLLAIMVFTDLVAWPGALCAAEGDVQYRLSDAWGTGGFEHAAAQHESRRETPAAVIDPAFVQASYARERNRGQYPQVGMIRAGYDGGFVIASTRESNLEAGDAPFLLRLNGWGQLRHTVLDSHGPNAELNQFQLKRARLVFSGHAFTPDFEYFVQLDGRSSSGDDIRLLDYFLTYDIGHHRWGLDSDTVQFKTGLYKVPFTMARYLSGREFEFTDRSVASMFFDVNRSLAWGLYGERTGCGVPWNWEVAIFNGLVTGGAETGSSGALDADFAYSGRLAFYPIGEWGRGQLADFEHHETPAVRTGMAFASSTIDRSGSVEFQSARVVDSGATLASLLPRAGEPVHGEPVRGRRFAQVAGLVDDARILLPPDR